MGSHKTRNKRLFLQGPTVVTMCKYSTIDPNKQRILQTSRDSHFVNFIQRFPRIVNLSKRIYFSHPTQLRSQAFKVLIPSAAIELPIIYFRASFPFDDEPFSFCRKRV